MSSDFEVLKAWLPELPGKEHPDEIHTYLAPDGRYHDPNNLKTYFIDDSSQFFGINRSAAYIQTYQMIINASFNTILKELAKP